jgi:hypothetical protein
MSASYRRACEAEAAGIIRERLETALGASRPIPTDREELEIERLVPAHQRRVSVDQHASWRESFNPFFENPDHEL